MIRAISLSNFLAYENAHIETPEHSTIAVVGENGHGKSGLLESVLFALYGEGRESLQDMKRIGTDHMSVQVQVDIPNADSTIMKVDRGVKGAAGYCNVYINDELVASGGAKSKRSVAANVQDFINNAIGMSKEEFILTSFFGMDSNDSLMKVAPADRLDTLQLISGTNICADFQKKAKERIAEQEIIINGNTTAISTLLEVSEDPAEVEAELEEKSNGYKDLKMKLNTLLTEKTELSKDETRYQSLVTELETVRGKRETQMLQKDKLAKKIVTMKKEIQGETEYAANLIKDKKAYIEKQAKMKSVESLKEEYRKVKDYLDVTTASIELYKEIDFSAETCDCPLCEHELPTETVKKWEKIVLKSQEKIDEINAQLENIKNQANETKSVKMKLEQIHNMMETNVEDLLEMRTALSEEEKEFSIIESAIEKHESRMLTIKKEMHGFDELMYKIKKLDSDIGIMQVKVGAVKEAVAGLKRGLETCGNNTLKVKELDKALDEAKRYREAYSLVADSFSRYAIPVQLLRNIRNAIQKRATRIYHYFANGEIRIDDVEGARPGVEFVLYDEIGRRRYKALSTGQKIMVFLSVRIAIMQIINASRNNQVDFLVLDEIAGNLSAKNRDTLMKLINTVLRKFFNQVFMVSHVELRDIFDTTYDVVMKDGISKVSMRK